MDRPAIAVTGAEELAALVGAELPPTPWLALTRELVVLFDDATLDGPSTNYCGAASARNLHGTHTLSLVVPLWERTVGVRGFRGIALYGIDRVRFPASVPVGTRVRGRFRVMEVVHVTGGVRYMTEATIEREGETKPARVAELIFRVFA